MANPILIYEPLCVGHHLKYVQLLIRAFADRGRDVVLASTRDAFDSAEYATLLRERESLFTKVVLDAGRPESHLTPLLNFWRVLTLAQRHGCDRVFLPFLDVHFRTLGILAGWRPSARKIGLEGILFNGGLSFDTAPKDIKDRMRRWVVRTILTRGRLQRVLFLDEAIWDSYRRNLGGARSRLVLCPDPVANDHSIPAEEFRTRFGIPPDAHVLGVFGLIDARKGVDLLIRALERYRPAAHEYLFLMGQHTPEVRDQIRRSPVAGHILSVDQFVTDDELVSGIHAMDVIAAVYPQHTGSASIVIRAAAAGRPVLGSDYGWIGRTIEKHGLGLACRPSDESSILRGISWAFRCPEVDEQRAHAFAWQNSVERFTQVICALDAS